MCWTQGAEAGGQRGPAGKRGDPGATPASSPRSPASTPVQMHRDGFPATHSLPCHSARTQTMLTCVPHVHVLLGTSKPELMWKYHLCRCN